ncbi:MAG: hypothetical protein RL385_4592, partial [Pseudomonadota bacterium]
MVDPALLPCRVARRAGPCDAGVVSSDRPSNPPVRPAQFVVSEDALGRPKLDVVE